MKLLLDENISFRLKYLINDIFDEIIHVTTLSNVVLSDDEIWNIAKLQNYIILTNDRDFEDLSVFLGMPPKVIIIKTGNLNKNLLSEKIRNNISEITDFYYDKQLRILEIY